MTKAPGDPELRNPDLPAEAGPDASIVRRLTGSINCIRCGYELKGLSVRVECPECGAPVLASLLALVDPKAHELALVRRPRLLTVGLASWGVGWTMAVGAAAAWVAIDAFGDPRTLAPAVAFFSVALTGLCVLALGSLPIIRPLDNMPARAVRAGAWASALQIVLALAMLAALLIPAIGALAHDFLPVALAAGGCAILLARGNLRRLESRSLIFRRGEIARQRMLPIALSMLVMAGVALLGAICVKVSSRFEAPARILESTVLSVGFALCLIGFVGVLRDILKVLPSVRTPIRSARAMMDDGAPDV